MLGTCTSDNFGNTHEHSVSSDFKKGELFHNYYLN